MPVSQKKSNMWIPWDNGHHCSMGLTPPRCLRLVLTGLFHLCLADGGFCGRLLGCRPRRMPVCQGSIWQCFYWGCFIYATWSWNWNRKSRFSKLITKNVTLISNDIFGHLTYSKNVWMPLDAENQSKWHLQLNAAQSFLSGIYWFFCGCHTVTKTYWSFSARTLTINFTAVSIHSKTQHSARMKIQIKYL